MDWKTKVLLLVLVLFGSVVPVSAQDPQGSAGILQNVVVSVSAALGAVVALLAFWWKFDSKIDANAKETNGKIDRTNERIDANARETNGKIDRTNERIDAAKNDLKDDAQKAHAEIGTNIRESEKRLNDNINKVHATVQLLLEQAIRGQSSGPAQDRP